MISAVLFDLDGTLLDTAQDFQTATNELLMAKGQQPLGEEGIRPHVTNGSIGIIRSVFNLEVSNPDFKPLQQQLLANYQACMTDKTCVFPGLESSLEFLRQKQIPWGIVTNKPYQYAKAIVEALVPECSVLVCPDHVKITKPDPEGLFLATKKLNVAPERCLYIGDHKRDIDAGAAAGMDTVAVGWGYINHEVEDIEDWNATHLICKPSELLGILENYRP